VALWLAVTAPNRFERAGLMIAAAVCSVVTYVGLRDAGGLSLALERNEGATAGR
jgi:hypothetical protein